MLAKLVILLAGWALVMGMSISAIIFALTVWVGANVADIIS